MRRAYVFWGFEDHGRGAGVILAVIEAGYKKEAEEKFARLNLKVEPFMRIGSPEKVVGEIDIKRAFNNMEQIIKDKYDYIGFLQKELEVLQFNRKKLKETGNF